MSRDPVLKYRCNECGELHDDEYDANSCCEPTISEVYLCAHCQSQWLHDEDAARECCNDIDADTPPMISKADLEAAGQLRLCP